MIPLSLLTSVIGLEACEQLCLPFHVGSGIYTQVLMLGQALLTSEHLSSSLLIFVFLILENKTKTHCSRSDNTRDYQTCLSYCPAFNPLLGCEILTI